MGTVTLRARISTTEYFFSHGKAPRGDGTWAFEFRLKGIPELVRRRGIVHTGKTIVFWSTGLYSDACKQVYDKAKDYVAEYGGFVDSISVLP